MAYVPLENTGERLIPDLDAGGWNSAVHHSRYACAAPFVRPEAQILDYGCGTGYGLQQLASVTQGTCVGVDKLEAVAYAQFRYGAPNIQYVAADITQPGARFGKFDLIVSFDVIEHLEDIDTYLENIAAQLRDDNSIAIVSTPWSLRRDNLSPLHNVYHTCELTATEFVQRLERHHLQIEELTLTMGMMAYARRQGPLVKRFDEQIVSISGYILGVVEDCIETYSQQCEKAELWQVDLAWLSRRAGRPDNAGEAMRRARHALRTTVAIDRNQYRCRRLHDAQTYTVNLTATARGLAGIDLMLAVHDQWVGGDVVLALYDGDTCVAQATKPAVLITDEVPSRFLFPVLPGSMGTCYRLQVTYTSTASARQPKLWCNAQGEPCYRTIYRRYEWLGTPYLIPAARLLVGEDKLPPLPTRIEQVPDGYIAPVCHEQPALPSRLEKLRRAYGQDELAGVVRTFSEYVRWRLGRH